MLHTVNKSPFRYDTLGTCVRFLQPGDAILLIEDGVYGAQAGTAKSEIAEKVMANFDVYALTADLKARGIAKLLDGVKVIDYEGFVELTEKHQVNSWL